MDIWGVYPLDIQKSYPHTLDIHMILMDVFVVRIADTLQFKILMRIHQDIIIASFSFWWHHFVLFCRLFPFHPLDIHMTNVIAFVYFFSNSLCQITKKC
jgi:hypothetical protein